MKGTLFSADFIEDINGDLRLLEINTDTSFLNSALLSIDFTEFFTVLNDNNITEVNVVYKYEIHSNFVNHLSSSIASDAPFITSFVKTIVPANTIFPTTVEDSSDKFVLRLAYDETSILDSEYAKGTLNLLKLFVDEGDSGSVCNFYHSSSIGGVYNTLDYQINDSSLLPDLVVKPVVERRVASKFYKLGKQELTAETRYDEFITNVVEPDTMIQQYHFNQNSITDNNKITSIRSFKIVYGSNLDLISLVDYEIESILDLPTDLTSECDNTIIDNLLSSKHYYEFATNFTKITESTLGGLLGNTLILNTDGTYTEIQNLQVNDSVVSYYISGSPQTDNSIDILNWNSEGIYLPDGSYLTSSIVVNKINKNVDYNSINEIIIDGVDKIYTGTKKMFLVYDSGSNQTVYKYASTLNPLTDYFYDASASIFPITENNLFITNIESVTLTEIDVESTDTYLISGSNHYNMIITHNPLCFVAGTKITLSDNTTKNIEDIQIGDEVLTFNEKTNQQEINKVLSLKQPIHNDLVTYTFTNGTTLTCTFDHPFYVNGLNLSSYKPNLTNQRYDLDTEINQIQIGDVVKTTDSGETKIESIVELDTNDTKTFIFSVENNHNFYANDILTHNKYCFIAGTQITMADGTFKNIEDVVIGDEVITLNEETKLNEVKKVIDTKSPTHNDLVKYTLSNGVEVTSTFDHPFYVNKMELASYAPKLTNERYELGVHVRKIQKSDCVYMIPKDGGLGMHAVAIEKIEPQPLVDTQTYIFTVEDNHNFYANGILTHNK